MAGDDVNAFLNLVTSKMSQHPWYYNDSLTAPQKAKIYKY